MFYFVSEPHVVYELITSFVYFLWPEKEMGELVFVVMLSTLTDMRSTNRNEHT